MSRVSTSSVPTQLRVVGCRGSRARRSDSASRGRITWGWWNLVSRRIAPSYRAGLSHPAAHGLGGRCTGRPARGELLRESRGRADRPPALLTAQTAAWRDVFGLIEGFCHIRWLRSAGLHVAWADFEELRQTGRSGVARPSDGGGHLARRAPPIIGVPHHDTPHAGEEVKNKNTCQNFQELTVRRVGAGSVRRGRIS